jgi:hypothetical protein
MQLAATSARLCASRWFPPAFTVLLGGAPGAPRHRRGPRHSRGSAQPTPGDGMDSPRKPWPMIFSSTAAWPM